MHPGEGPERESLRRPERHVELQPRPASALVLLAIDVDGHVLDLPEQQVIRTYKQLSIAQAGRGAAVAPGPDWKSYLSVFR
jgi:hypothetical protein